MRDGICAEDRTRLSPGDAPRLVGGAISRRRMRHHFRPPRRAPWAQGGLVWRSYQRNGQIGRIGPSSRYPAR
jgi:hypothetical protein